LADSYALLNVPAYGSLTSASAAAKAKDMAMKALQLDETLGEAYTSLGIVKLRYEWNWYEAEDNFQKAIEIKPDYAPVHFWYSQLLIYKGQFDKALEEGQKAKELDPLYPNYEINMGRIRYFQRENDKAIQIFSEILNNNPQSENAAYLLGLTYLQKGSNDEAINIAEQFYKKNKGYFATLLGYAYGKAGRNTEALKVLNELEEEKRAKQEYLPPQEEAIIYIGLNDKDKAFEKLNQSCGERFSAFPFLLKEQITDALRADSRFVGLESCVKPLN
jgi:tetratricopeptide (TPR) repeat protein